MVTLDALFRAPRKHHQKNNFNTASKFNWCRYIFATGEHLLTGPFFKAHIIKSHSPLLRTADETEEFKPPQRSHPQAGVHTSRLFVLLTSSEASLIISPYLSDVPYSRHCLSKSFLLPSETLRNCSFRRTPRHWNPAHCLEEIQRGKNHKPRGNGTICVFQPAPRNSHCGPGESSYVVFLCWGGALGYRRTQTHDEAL